MFYRNGYFQLALGLTSQEMHVATKKNLLEDAPHGLFDHAHFYSLRQKIRGMDNLNSSNFATLQRNVSNDHLKCWPGQNLQYNVKHMQIYSAERSPDVER